MKPHASLKVARLSTLAAVSGIVGRMAGRARRGQHVKRVERSPVGEDENGQAAVPPGYHREGISISITSEDIESFGNFLSELTGESPYDVYLHDFPLMNKWEDKIEMIRSQWPEPRLVIPGACTDESKALENARAGVLALQASFASSGTKPIPEILKLAHKRVADAEAALATCLAANPPAHVSSPSATQLQVGIETHTEWSKLMDVFVGGHSIASMEVQGGWRQFVTLEAADLPRTSIIFAKPAVFGFYVKRYKLGSLGPYRLEGQNGQVLGEGPGLMAGERVLFRWLED